MVTINDSLLHFNYRLLFEQWTPLPTSARRRTLQLISPSLSSEEHLRFKWTPYITLYCDSYVHDFDREVNEQKSLDFLSSNLRTFLFFCFIQRGWTTWTTGIVDKRVVGMVPIVEDLLNMKKVCRHYFLFTR